MVKYVRGQLTGPKGTSFRISNRKSGLNSILECEEINCETQLTYNELEDCYEIKVTLYKGPDSTNNWHKGPNLKTFTYKTNEE